MIKKLNEQIENLLNLNEIAFVTKPDYTDELKHSHITSIVDTLFKRKRGFVQTTHKIRLCPLNSIKPFECYLCLNWGEPDKGKVTGQGLCHIVQGHGVSTINKLKNILPKLLKSNKTFMEDPKNLGNFTVVYLKTKIVISVNTNNTQQAVLISAYNL